MAVPQERRPDAPPVAADPAGEVRPTTPAGGGDPVPHTRTGAVWAGVWAGVVVLVLLIVFVAQNTTAVQVSFFALEGRLPLALALLVAGVAGAVIALAVAAARIVQLRRLLRRGR